MTTINLMTITNEDIAAAAKVDDLDDALLPIMQKAGIEDGGPASICFDEDEWRDEPDGRIGQIRNWLESEATLYNVPCSLVGFTPFAD